MPPLSLPILPGKTVGILGDGQLGRMLAQAAHELGYKVGIFAPAADNAPVSPASQVADWTINADYTDEAALTRFAKQVAVVTVEFENIPAETLTFLAKYVPVRPNAVALSIFQHRLTEKQWLQDQGIPVAPFEPVNSYFELIQALATIGYPAVLKTAGFGYDGKGQTVIKKPLADAALQALYQSYHHQPAVLEAWIDYRLECSVVAARSEHKTFTAFPVFQNAHRHQILDVTRCPADVTPPQAKAATAVAQKIMDTLDYIGVLTVEFFLTASGTLLVNEVAPRVHNSGHLTIEACETSQFEQHIRAICGLPLGGAALIQPAAMANLLGDEWADPISKQPRACEANNLPKGVALHLYGKADARPGRKMGHLSAVADSSPEAEALVKHAREAVFSTTAPLR